jgi:DNA-binding GntR family transcriptional regulator
MPIPQIPEPIDRRPMRSQVYVKIRDWIISGALSANEQVRDSELALRLGVSRTPVREALQRLEDEGLVQTMPNRWTRVSPIEVGDARRLYPVICALECVAVRASGARLSAADLKEMDEANGRLIRALRRKNPVAASLADCDFHFVPVRGSHNPELITVVQDLKVKLRRLEVTYFHRGAIAERSTLEHKRILAALRRKEVEAAAACIEANWRNSLARITGDPTPWYG